jgi:2-keto-4-pentenoate hydratase/2-oxohepta-3-ene-1,7-dioic acid hydratase in catechol pathway
LPGKIICIVRNYEAHAQEHGNTVGEITILFFKPTTSLVGFGEAIVLPPQSQQVQHEAELASLAAQRLSAPYFHGHARAIKILAHLNKIIFPSYHSRVRISSPAFLF